MAYRWIGAGGNARWSNPGNWQVLNAAGTWEASRTPPAAASSVLLDDAAPDAPQVLELDYHVEVRQLILDASGARTYTLRSWVDADDTGIDSDSGMLYSLRLTAAEAVRQLPTAQAEVILKAETILAAHPARISLLSRHGARLVAEKRLRRAGELQVDQGRDGADGKLIEPAATAVTASGTGTGPITRAGAARTTATAAAVALAAGGAEMMLAKDGKMLVPLVVPAGAPPSTVQAAQDLALYLEKITGSRPELLTGDPQPPPAAAIWVGKQARTNTLFPGTDLSVDKPEEILLVCNGQHLLICGRDLMIGTVQTEHGTANAVYTFLQEQLGVRWLWPGELGEDVPKNPNLRVAAFTYRFNPPFLQRQAYRPGGDWPRYQRLALDSLRISAGHAFNDWWEKYSVSHPDYFALQPDGTRSCFPSAHNIKLCESSPAVWAQWLRNTEEALERNPLQKVFNAAPNDGSNAGICMCDKCKAWDHPDGPLRMLSWAGKELEYPAMSDRYVTFWNHLSVLLRQRFPDRDLWISGFAYGPAKPAPIAVAPANNVVIGYVGHFPLSGGEMREVEKAEWEAWSRKAPHLIFRPNLFYYTGGWHALPTLALRKTGEDFRFLAEHSCMGITVDGMPAHWAQQGVQYYLMAQLTWNPLQDSEAVVQDFCRRAFGPAAAEMRAYFDLWDQAHDRVVERPGFRHGMGVTRATLSGIVAEVYTPDLLDRAGTLLAAADARAAAAPEIYRQRLAFIRTGLDFTRILTRSMAAMDKVRRSGGKDTAAVNAAIALCAERDQLFERHQGLAINAQLFNYTWRKGRGLDDFLGPPSENFRLAAGLLREYRWTGAADRKWSTPGNWQVRRNEKWIPADRAPAGTDIVRVGEVAEDGAARTVLLDGDVTIARVVYSATGRATFTVAQAPGMTSVPTLSLTGAQALTVTTGATAALRLEVQTRLCEPGNSVILLESPGAPLVIAKPLRGGQLVAVQGGQTSAGMLELQAPLTATRVELTGNAQLRFNGPEAAIKGSFTGRSGSLLLSQDSLGNGDVFQYGSRTTIRPFGLKGDKEVVLAFRNFSRGGTLRVDAAEGDEGGTAILAVNDIEADGGATEAPRVELALHACLELRGSQPCPTRVDRSAGVHGSGALVRRLLPGTKQPIGVIGDRNTYTGGTFIWQGGLRLEQATIPVNSRGSQAEEVFRGCLGPGPLYLGQGTVFMLNGLDQEVAGLADLKGAGRIDLGGGRLTINVLETAAPASPFSGSIGGPGTLIKTGSGSLRLTTYMGSAGQTLRSEAGIVAVRDEIALNGSKLELAGGRVTAARLDSRGQVWRLELPAAAGIPGSALVAVDNADIADASLELVVKAGASLKPGTTLDLLRVNGELKGGEARVFGRTPGQEFTVDGSRLRLMLQRDGSAKVVQLTVL